MREALAQLFASEGMGKIVLNMAAGVQPTQDPHADFTDFQWYCYQARQTVFFIAFVKEAPTQSRLVQLAEDLLQLAPQLSTGFVGATGNATVPATLLSQLLALKQVDDLSAYPEAFDVAGDDIFDNKHLPLFRVQAAALKGGPDDQGRAGAIAIVASHALLEGLDSVQLSRSKVNDRTQALPVKPIPWHRRMFTGAQAWLTGPLQLLVALIVAPFKVDRTYKSLSLERSRLRQAAAKLGINQRSLMFALALFALNQNGKGFSKQKISTTYVDLDPRHQGTAGDGFFRFRMMEAKFPVHQDFASFARTLDQKIKQAEHTDTTATQRFLTALFGVHRTLRKTLPFLYSDRIFRFGGTYHVNLSLTPPHWLSGPMTRDMMEPIFCGTLHPALNDCVFVPGRKMVTFNFTVSNRLVKDVELIPGLLNNVLSTES